MLPTLSPRAAPHVVRNSLDKHTREGAAHLEEHYQPERSDYKCEREIRCGHEIVKAKNVDDHRGDSDAVFTLGAARAAASICRRAPQVWAKKDARTSGMAHSAQAANWILCPCPANRVGCTVSRPRQRRASNPAASAN